MCWSTELREYWCGERALFACASELILSVISTFNPRLIMSFGCGVFLQATKCRGTSCEQCNGLAASIQFKTLCSVRWAFAVRYCDYCLVLETDGGYSVHSGRQEGSTSAACSQVGFRNQASESLYALWRPWTGEHILVKTDENISDLDRLGRFPGLTFRRKQYRPTQNLSHCRNVYHFPLVPVRWESDLHHVTRQNQICVQF